MRDPPRCRTPPVSDTSSVGCASVLRPGRGRVQVRASARGALFDCSHRVAALEHRGGALHQPVPVRHLPPKRVGEANDHVEQRRDVRGVVERRPRHAGGVRGLGVGLGQLVGVQGLLLDEPECGAQSLVDRRGAPVGSDPVPDLLTERVRRDRAVGAQSEKTLVQM
jgi:hypothetical protein